MHINPDNNNKNNKKQLHHHHHLIQQEDLSGLFNGVILFGFADLGRNERFIVHAVMMKTIVLVGMDAVLLLERSVEQSVGKQTSGGAVVLRLILRAGRGGAIGKSALVILQHFGEIILKGVEDSDDGGRAEAVRYQAEVSEVSLNGGVEDGRRLGAAQRRSVVAQQVGKLFGYLLGGYDHGLARLYFGRVRMMLSNILGRLFRRKLVFAHKVEVARQMNGLALDQRGEQSDSGGLAASGRQIDADALQFFAEHAAAVLGFGASQDAAEEGSV
ncbi:hypothetical protein BpHYR1_034682 [Brachionus plicatilis]|uniref:Uncharacterized protein n=1 Tax=Brachionus plicatilis TaxID=10195 RepID=A0A3M7SH50_BRAPC|nr:hypothetical protein BpHYR1_034682 [Brachionus plicatilis]